MKYFKYLLLTLVIILFDQLSKLYIASHFKLYEFITVIPGFFEIKYVQNTGAGFSILQGQMLFFYLITAGALIFLGYLFKRSLKNSPVERISIIMMIAGAIGNFIDRIRLGYVIDFLAFDIFGYHFPVFNIADSFLTVGVILFILITLWESKHEKA